MNLCEVRSESDVDWVVRQVARGDHVVVQLGGIRRPRRRRLKPRVALCQLETRLRAAGGRLEFEQSSNRLRLLIRGRLALGVPDGHGPDPVGVREPRRPLPGPWQAGAVRAIPAQPS